METSQPIIDPAHLAAIVESSDDAIISKDLAGTITSWNPAATRIFGYTPDDVIGKSIRLLVPPERQSEEDAILERLRAGQRIEHYETERLTKDGRRLAISLTISPIRDITGKIVGASKIARDITERKRLELELITREKLAGVARLALTMAHEINNPLEGAVNLVYLARTTSREPAVQRWLLTAEHELSRVTHLARQTLSFYCERSERSPARAADLLREVVAVVSSKARNRGVKVRPEVLGDPEIVINQNDYRQLLANLIGNSIDACPRGGTVRVRVSARQQCVGAASGLAVTVADNGVGISSIDRKRVFDAFFTTKKDVGTGLGLWVCKQIVEKYGGRIQARSDDRPGRSWTVVRVFLPILVAEVVAAGGHSSNQAA
jgi:PAS domain S-box-containing protein